MLLKQKDMFVGYSVNSPSDFPLRNFFVIVFSTSYSYIAAKLIKFMRLHHHGVAKIGHFRKK